MTVTAIQTTTGGIANPPMWTSSSWANAGTGTLKAMRVPVIKIRICFIFVSNTIQVCDREI